MSPSSIHARRELSEGLQRLVAAVTFAPACYVIVIPDFIEF